MASLGGIHGGWTLRAAQLHHSLRHWPTTRAPGIVQMRIGTVFLRLYVLFLCLDSDVTGINAWLSSSWIYTGDGE